MTNDGKLSKALKDFRKKYPSVTSADLQTFIIGWQEAVKNYFTSDDSNHLLFRIEPYFDGISAAVTAYKVVDQEGTLQYIGNKSQCEFFIKTGFNYVGI